MAYRENWIDQCKHLGLDMGECTDSHRKYDGHVFLVYLHINKINGKVYVGITHHANPNKRWGYSGQKYTHSIKFANAIRKYGWEGFEHKILCRTTRERAIVLEKTLIYHFKKLGMSYNITDGGDGADCISENNRRIISERMQNNHPMKGKHHTLEARKKISEANRRRIYTEEQKEQLRAAGKIGRETMRKRGFILSEESIKKITQANSRPVIQLDLEGNFLMEFSSAIEADKFINNGKRCNHIADACNGKRKTANGYKWMYKEERRIA